jgi:hypothetical protein
MKKLFILLLILFNTTAYADTPTVWKHHISAWEARNLDEIVSDYDEKSILILNGEIFKGPAQIRSVFTSLFKIFDQGTNKISPPTIIENIVYIQWSFTPQGSQEFDGTDTFIIENDKIKIQTIASKLYDFMTLKEKVIL